MEISRWCKPPDSGLSTRMPRQGPRKTHVVPVAALRDSPHCSHWQDANATLVLLSDGQQLWPAFSHNHVRRIARRQCRRGDRWLPA